MRLMPTVMLSIATFAAPVVAAPRLAPPPVQPRALHSTVTFSPSSAELGVDAQLQLDGIARWLNESADREVVVEAHPDWVGTADYDSSLVERRGMQVKRYLVTQGIDPVRILVSAPGKPIPETNGGSPLFLRTIFVRSHAADTPATSAVPPSTPEAEVLEPERNQPEPGPGPELNDVLDDGEDRLFGAGLSMSVGGGAVGLLDQQTNDFAQVGGGWEARLAYGTRWPVAVEAAYFGSAQEIDALGLDSDAVLLGNGVEGNLRVNFNTGAVFSYLLAGAGWTRFELANTTTNTSSIKDHDDVMHLPFGAGVGYRRGRVLMDVRATIRPALSDDMLDAPFANSDRDAKMTTWNVGAKLGFEF